MPFGSQNHLHIQRVMFQVQYMYLPTLLSLHPKVSTTTLHFPHKIHLDRCARGIVAWRSGPLSDFLGRGVIAMYCRAQAPGQGSLRRFCSGRRRPRLDDPTRDLLVDGKHSDGLVYCSVLYYELSEHCGSLHERLASRFSGIVLLGFEAFLCSSTCRMLLAMT